MKHPLSNLTLIARGALLIAIVFMLVSCGESLTAQPTPLPTPTATTMTDTIPTQPVDDVGGPRPVPTSEIGPTSGIITGPIVGTSVAGGPVEGPPLSQIPTPTPHPPLVPGPDGIVLLKTADRPTAVIMSVGDTLKLELEDFYDWTVGVSDPTILVPEADGTYRASRPGSATLELQGDPKCLKFDTPCGAPSIALTVTVTIK